MQFISLANYLRRHRKRRYLSQDAVARIVPVRSRASVARHELGTRLPDLRTALAYAALYGIPIEELFAGESREMAELVKEGLAIEEARKRQGV